MLRITMKTSAEDMTDKNNLNKTNHNCHRKNGTSSAGNDDDDDDNDDDDDDDDDIWASVEPFRS